jgi:hypothetical protein
MLHTRYFSIFWVDNYGLVIYDLSVFQDFGSWRSVRWSPLRRNEKNQSLLHSSVCPRF